MDLTIRCPHMLDRIKNRSVKLGNLERQSVLDNQLGRSGFVYAIEVVEL